MQVRDVMTPGVVTVGPDTSVKYAAEVLAEHGYAALPVVSDDNQLIGIVAEIDVLRDRIPADPRLHILRQEESDDVVPLLVRGVMTEGVRSVDAGADVADIARLFVDQRLRSVPVLERGRLVGIVSRRDLLHGLVRPDDLIRQDLLRLIGDYTGDLDDWDITVVEGVATVRRTGGTPDPSPEVEDRTLRTLAKTVPGIVAVRVHTGPDAAKGQHDDS